MNYKQITNEVKESRLLLQKAYERGYKQGQADYKKPTMKWIAVSVMLPTKDVLQFRCNNCGELAITKYPHCPWCGCPEEKEEKK